MYSIYKFKPRIYTITTCKSGLTFSTKFNNHIFSHRRVCNKMSLVIKTFKMRVQFIYSKLNIGNNMLACTRHLLRYCSLYSTSASGSGTSDHSDLSDSLSEKQRISQSYVDPYSKFFKLLVRSDRGSYSDNTLLNNQKTASKNVKNLEGEEYRSYSKYMPFHIDESAKSFKVQE